MREQETDDARGATDGARGLCNYLATRFSSAPERAERARWSMRFGFGWLSNFHPEGSVRIHHQALLDLIQTLTVETIADPKQVFLLGFPKPAR